ncbi:MAG: hypothetical protein PVH40_08705 [Gemmatimonadales bacterium]|jgi:hypothetical protein
MFNCNRIFPLAAALAIGVSTGCSDSTGPQDFDPITANDAATELLTTFDDNPALLAIDILGTAFPNLGSQAPAAAPSAPLSTELPAGVRKDLRILTSVGPFLNPANPAAIFPADYLGATFVYNTETGQYEVAPDSTGAPDSGIRLKLYAVDPVLRQPIEPLDDIGYLDLTDESSPSADALGVLAVVQEVTYLEYVASATQTTGAVTFTADGYLFDGTSQVRFTLSHDWSEATGATVDYSVWVPEQDPATAIDLYLNIDPEAELVTLELSVTHDGETVSMEVIGSDTSISGTVSYNGDVVVTISGTPAQPVFTDSAGNALTNQDLQALAALFGSIGIILDAFDNLLVPAYLVFSVSILAGW